MLLVEVFINVIHSPPGLNYTFTFSQLGRKMRYSMDSVITVLMLARVYIFFSLFSRFTKWRNTLAEHCCEAAGTQANTLFAMKCLLKESPYTLLIFNAVFSSLVFGFAVRTLERPYYEDEVGGAITPDDAGYQDYNFVSNGWWLIVVTMTTVGFGDFFPKTHLGRGVVVLACFYGVFLVSMMVVTLSESSEFTQSEKKVN